jgi:hypothetical protein
MRSPILLASTVLLFAAGGCAAPDVSPTALRPSSPSLAGGKVTNPTATFVIANDAAYGLRGDGTFLETDGGSRYANGECGVGTTIFALSGGSGDATMGVSLGGKCRRKIHVSYESINADGSTTAEGTLTVAGFLNVRALQVAATATTSASYIPIGTDAPRNMAIDDVAMCGGLGTGAIAFVPVLRDGTVTNADQVNVHRDAADLWTVTTLPDEVDADGNVVHHDKAYCKGNGKLYHMPLRLTIRSSVPLAG